MSGLNFNSKLPAAPTNGTNVTWATDKNGNISASLVDVAFTDAANDFTETQTVPVLNATAAINIDGSPVSAADTPGAAVTTETVGASPYVFTATVRGFMAVFGGTVSAISIGRGVSNVNAGLLSGIFPLSAGDTLTVTYTVVPTMYFLPT